jgi:uncharacterized protein YqeY
MQFREAKMSIKSRIAEDTKTAMKAGEKARVMTLRMLRSRMQEAEVHGRATAGRDFELDEDAEIQVLSTYAKQRRESIESYRTAGREDLAAREEAELTIVQEYLPKQLGPDEIREIVKQAIDEVGATSPREMGAVMKVVMPKLKGVADGRAVNQLVKELLG